MPNNQEPRTIMHGIGEHSDLFIAEPEAIPIISSDLDFVTSLNNEPQNVIFDCINNKLWVIKAGGSEKNAEDCLSIDGKRFCELIGTDPNSGLVELTARGFDVDMRNWPKSYAEADKRRVISKLKQSALKLASKREKEGLLTTSVLNEPSSLSHFLESAGVDEETATKIKDAKDAFEKRAGSATNTFLDGIQKVMDKVPNKYIALFILEISPFGYGLADILTALSGIRDISEGRSLGTNHDKALLRGSLKIIGALTPVIPTFWVEPVLKTFMPISEIDAKPKK